MTSLLGQETIYSITGSKMHPQFPVPKVMYLQQRQPELARRAVHYDTANDYVYRILGCPGTMDYLEQQGMEWLRSFHAGMLTTCGFSNVGGPCQDERRIFGLQSFGLHGRLTHIPANEVCCKGEWLGGRYVMTVQGLMRQSAVHGENLTLRRTITAVLGEPKLRIHDVIENEGHTAEPFMLLYHMNFGYPLLSPQSRLVVRSDAVRSADETAQAEIDQYASFHEPMHLRDEHCYADGPIQSWSRVLVGSRTLFPTITGENFEFGFSDSILQMWAAYMSELDGRELPFGCVKPEHTHLSHAEQRAVKVEYVRNVFCRFFGFD